MSTQAAVRAAWAAGVWAASAITTLTDKIYDFDIEALAKVSRAHVAKLYYAQKINFFQYTITRGWRFDLTAGHTVCEYIVTVRYYRDAQEDFTGTAFNAAMAAVEAVVTAVAAMGTSWSSTVEYYEPQNEPPAIVPVVIDERPCWMAQYQFRGTKQI